MGEPTWKDRPDQPGWWVSATKYDIVGERWDIEWIRDGETFDIVPDDLPQRWFGPIPSPIPPLLEEERDA